MSSLRPTVVERLAALEEKVSGLDKALNQLKWIVIIAAGGIVTGTPVAAQALEQVAK